MGAWVKVLEQPHHTTTLVLTFALLVLSLVRRLLPESNSLVDLATYRRPNLLPPVYIAHMDHVKVLLRNRPTCRGNGNTRVALLRTMG